MYLTVHIHIDQEEQEHENARIKSELQSTMREQSNKRANSVKVTKVSDDVKVLPGLQRVGSTHTHSALAKQESSTSAFSQASTTSSAGTILH